MFPKSFAEQTTRQTLAETPFGDPFIGMSHVISKLDFSVTLCAQEDL
jgi:hypothetical protein